MSNTVKFQLSGSIVYASKVRRPKEVIECTRSEAVEFERRGKGKRLEAPAEVDEAEGDGLEDKTVAELRDIAGELEIDGVWELNKAPLIQAIREARDAAEA